MDPAGEYLNQAAALIGAGAGTIVYLLFTKFKSPVFLGSSFAFILPLGTALSCGYFGIIFGAFIAALVYVVLALIIKAIGTGWMNKYLPPIVLGPTVAMIGFSLATSAMPAFPGAHQSSCRSESCARRHVIACSRPPLPTIRIFMPPIIP